MKPFRLKLAKRIFKGITFLSCFEFKDGGILTQRSAKIGCGNFVEINQETENLIKQISDKNEFICEIMRSDQSHSFNQDIDPSLCAPERRKISNFKKPGTIETSKGGLKSKSISWSQSQNS